MSKNKLENDCLNQWTYRNVPNTFESERVWSPGPLDMDTQLDMFRASCSQILAFMSLFSVCGVWTQLRYSSVMLKFLSCHLLLPGMGLQAFVEAFFYLAGRRFKSLVLKEQVAALLSLCEAQLGPQLSAEDRRSLSCSRALLRPIRTQTLCPPHPLLSSPASQRRAASHQRLKPRTLRANVENWWEGTTL